MSSTSSSDFNTENCSSCERDNNNPSETHLKFRRSTLATGRAISKSPKKFKPISKDMLLKKKCTTKRSEPLWQVKKLRNIPQGHDVVRTSRFIRETDVNEICTRIVQVLKKIGIAAQYDSIKAVAYCETIDFLKLNISLYQGTGEYSDGVIVEVRRINSENGIKFIKDCGSILDAAEGDIRPENKEISNTPISEMTCLQNCSEILNKKLEYVSDALDVSERYLQHKCDDVQIIGLKSLVSLLDQKQCCSSTVSIACKSILTGKINPGIHMAIVAYLENNDYSNPDYAQCDKKLHSLALNVMEKAFIASKDICMESFDIALHADSWIVDTLTPILVYDLQNITFSQFDALTSIKCLKILICASILVKEKAVDCGVKEACEEAKQFGKISFDDMFRESNNLKELLF